MRGLLYQADNLVANWTWQVTGFHPMPVDRAIGIVDAGKLVGSIIWQNYNGHNVDLSYYGKNTLTLGILRNIAQFALQAFNPSRITVMTARSNKPLRRFLQRLGGVRHEGPMYYYYGFDTSDASTALRYMVPRAVIERLAKVEVAELRKQAS